MRPWWVSGGLGVLVAIGWGVVHALGWRDATTVIAGNVVDPSTALHGLVYVAAWLAAVAVAPVLVLGAALAAAWDAWSRRSEARRPE